MRHRYLTVTAPMPNGETQEQRHETTDNPAVLARIICGVADEHPGVAVAFTLTTTYEGEQPPHLAAQTTNG